MQLPIDQISDILGLAEKTGGALKVGLDVQERLKKIFGGKESIGDHEAERLVTDLLRELKEAHFAHIALQAQLSALLQAATSAQRMETEFARYELWKTPFGTLVYRLRQTDEATGEPEHYICPNCKEDGVKSILQGHEEYVKCPRCQQGYRIARDDPPDLSALARRLNR